MFPKFSASNGAEPVPLPDSVAQSVTKSDNDADSGAAFDYDNIAAERYCWVALWG